MGLKETIKNMQTLIENLNNDLIKAVRGVKAASQRVRTGTIRLAKIAKIYRKESVSEEKKMKKRVIDNSKQKKVKIKKKK